MQISLFGEMVVSTDNVIELASPVQFDCIVRGKKLRASLTHLERNIAHFIYHISFSDGHTAGFVAPSENSKWHDDRFASPYAKAIADDLNAFCGFLPSRPPFCLRLRQDAEAFNVWVVPYRSRENYYSVYYKGQNRFDLRRAGVWEAKETGKSLAVNQEIALQVCRTIEKRVACLQTVNG